MKTTALREFSYRAVNREGIPVKGVISAENRSSAVGRLRNKKLHVESIKEIRILLRLKKRMNRDDYLQFVTELIALLKAGLTVPEAIEQCSDRPANKSLSQALKGVLTDITSGEYLSTALLKNEDIFDSMFVSAVKTGESAGELVPPLEKYRIFLERKNAIRKKTAQALAYPVFIIAAMSLILGVLFVFVMPRFVAIYSEFDARLPGPTLFVLSIAENIRIILPAAAVIITGFYIFFKTASVIPGFKLVIDTISFNLPFAGKVIQPVEYAALARTLSTLISGGMPLAESLHIASAGLKNEMIRQKLNRVIKRVYEGEHFSQAAYTEDLFPKTAVKLLEAGESSGTIGDMLAEAAAYYEQIAENRLASLMSVMEPALIFITGIVIGSIIIVMYLPVFRLTEIIK